MPTFTARSTPEPSSIPTRPNSPISNLRRHPNYYLPGGDLFIQIDDTMFRVHSYFFIRESSLWLYLLRTITRGRTLHDPIILSTEFHITPTPTPQTFAQFLWIFYNPYYGVYDVSISTWWNIEVYAACWTMNNILDLVDRELHRLIQLHRHQLSTTPWHTLSSVNNINTFTTPGDTEETWTVSETPYEDWITNPEIDDEISLLLDRHHLGDGRD